MIFIAFQYPVKNLKFTLQTSDFKTNAWFHSPPYFYCKILTDRFPTDCCFLLKIYLSDFLNFEPNFFSSIDF